MLIPLAMGVSLLRYRLWDVDLLIRRTLVYAALTMILGLIYAGSVVLAGAVLHTLAGTRSPLVLVCSTLVIAALFGSLRRHIQNIIDHRFYRRRYDAAHVLAALGATIRDEIDLERLIVTVVGVVEETMQPRHVSLWLRERPAEPPAQDHPDRQ